MKITHNFIYKLNIDKMFSCMRKKKVRPTFIPIYTVRLLISFGKNRICQCCKLAFEKSFNSKKYKASSRAENVREIDAMYISDDIDCIIQ